MENHQEQEQEHTHTRSSRLDAFRQHVGVKPDREVADMAGLTTSAVQMYRKKHGIPSVSRRARLPDEPRPTRQIRNPRKTEDPQEVQAPRTTKPPTFRKAWAWKVTLQDTVKFVVAADMAEAVALAGEAGEVLTIERIGEGLQKG